MLTAGVALVGFYVSGYLLWKLAFLAAKAMIPKTSQTDDGTDDLGRGNT